MFPRRAGLVVWVSDAKFARNLERFGNVIYISRKLNYVLLYLNEEEVNERIPQLRKLNFVRKVEKSHRAELSNIFPTKKLG